MVPLWFAFVFAQNIGLSGLVASWLNGLLRFRIGLPLVSLEGSSKKALFRAT